MIYLDNAATTWPKPQPVRQAMIEAIERYGANPGRAGHAMAMAAARQIYACREEAAAFFHYDDPTRVIFTGNCTEALNMVIKGLLAEGGHAVISAWEHNSVVRPLEALSGKGVTYTVVGAESVREEDLIAEIRRVLRPDTRLILCTHASNVFGITLPVRAIGQLAEERGIPFAVDAAQSAGMLPLNMEKDHIGYLCLPGHKGLYGPMGTGLLICRCERLLKTVIEGGTGSQSLLMEQPEDLPDRLESGTLNVPGICGLRAAIGWLRRSGFPQAAGRETELVGHLYDRLAETPGIRLYTDRPSVGKAVSLLSLNVGTLSSEEVARRLSEEEIGVRSGLHCSPLAHRSKGTLPGGTVRLSISAFTRREEVENAYKILAKIARNS